ncbi:hypothetical protein F9C28_01645 [Shimwellia pseudoproteus]|uniref:Gfo/Idh/MocA family oxidoreductase n=1 Tax=Shimwellia pseudoproteus TaxID=570012 RepID=UPI0018ED05CA|nr:Gfo/Idh/MocA family oxidoreductase [Shimwellia pseudoproteus]MBJ3813665.1 hypothetical protein [Shimwellia pseudoproteus]
MSGEQPTTGAGIWVIGATFGAQYARALQNSGLRAIIGQGGARGRQLATGLGCDYYTGVTQALSAPHPACAVVAVRSAVVGGEGDEIARQLLCAGIPVLQGLPLHPQAMADTLRIARQQGTGFAVTPFYDQLPRVRRFLRAARWLSRYTTLRSVEMRVTVQTLHCALMVLSGLLGVPSTAVTTTPLAARGKVLVSCLWQGVPVDIILMNRFDFADPDAHAQPLMQITVVSDNGELTLYSPFGPLIREYPIPAEASMTAAPLLVTGQRDNRITAGQLHDAMGRGIRTALAQAMAQPMPSAATLQRQLAVLRLWRAVSDAAGHPLHYRPGEADSAGLPGGAACRR